MSTSLDHSTIRWHRRLETRVAAAITLLIAIALGAVLIATIRVVTDRSFVRGAEDVAVARSAFNRLVASRAGSAATEVRLITELPIFRRFLGDEPLARDVESIRAMADGYRSQLGAQFAIVTDRTGKWTASPGWMDGQEPSAALKAAIGSAVAGQSQSLLTVVAGRVLLVVAEPARFADETLGTMIVAFALDDALTRELAQVTQCDISLVAGTQLSASSLEGAGRAQLVRMLESGVDVETFGGAPVFQRFAGRGYLVGVYPLTAGASGDNGPRLLLMQDWAATQAFIDRLRGQFIRAGLFVFVLAMIGGLIFSRRMSRPFQDIAAAARDIAAGGNWFRQLPLRGGAEAMTTASAFNEMSTSLRHWYEDAQAKSARLEAAYERFHSVTESARDAIVSTNLDGDIVFWNRSASLIFGYKEAEIAGRPLTQLMALEDRPRYTEMLASTHDFGFGVDGGRIIELEGLRGDNVLFPMELSICRPDAQAPLTAIIRDITERRQAQQDLKQRDERLQQTQKMEAIGRLAGGVAHDFNNLLTAIIGFGGLIRESAQPSDQVRSDIDEVLGAAERAATLTRQLLAFSRRQVVMPQVVALDQIVAGTEKMLRRLIGEDVALSSTAAPTLGLVRADPGQVEQVLVNLVVNARDAMPEGGDLHINLRNVDVDAATAATRPGFVPGAYVCLSVTDSGTGIDAELLPHIFEPFFTTKEEGKGTGLGLATVYGIAKQNLGYVDVDSRPGQGTTFDVYFPRLDSAELSVPADLPVPVTERASETVLLVEDDDRVRGLLASVLRTRGYSVLEASRGDRAVELARDHPAPIHLLLSDVVMPGMSGRVVAMRVAELRPDTRVLLMSGYSDDAVLRSGIEAAKTPFMQKPFAMAALASKIREALSAPAVS